MVKVKPYNVADIDHNIKSNLINTILKVFYIILHIIFGLDYGFIKYKKPQHTFIFKLLIAAYIVFVNYQSFILFSNETKMFGLESVWYLKHLIENLIYIAILAFIPHQKSFFTFLVHLELIDSKIGARSSKYFCFKIIICCLISLTFKLISTITYCLRYEKCAANIWLHTVSTIPSFSFDLPFIVICFTFHLVSCRLVAIQKCIQNKTLEIIEIQRIYKSLADLTETAKKSFDPLLIITLLFNVPSVMIIIYGILKDAKINTQASYVMESITIVSLVIVIFAPSITASSLSTDVDKIKRTLYNTMLDESDQNKLQDIQRFINYTEARPFKFHVLKIVPLDATLPIVIINLCITYLIVILQLTHLY